MKLLKLLDLKEGWSEPNPKDFDSSTYFTLSYIIYFFFRYKKRERGKSVSSYSAIDLQGILVSDIFICCYFFLCNLVVIYDHLFLPLFACLKSYLLRVISASTLLDFPGSIWNLIYNSQQEILKIICLVWSLKPLVLAQVRKNKDNCQMDQKVESTCVDEPDPIICPDAGQH
jgi:hypothetical protein